MARRLERARQLITAFIAGAVGLSLVLTLFVSSAITHRLEHLTAVIARGDQGDLTVRAVPGADDEIGRLGRIFNSFLERLESSHKKLAAEIEEHRSTAVSLQQARDFNAMVLSTAEALVIVLDRVGRVVSFNRACSDCSGYSFEEVKNRFLWDVLIPEDEIETLKALFAELTATAVDNRHLHHWQTKAGALRDIQWSNASMSGPDGEIEYVVGVGLDITEQKAMENALRLSEAQFEAVFNRTYQLIGILAPDGTIRSANQTALDFAGLDRAEVAGRKFWETPFWQHSGEIQAALRQAIARAAQGEFTRMEVTHLRHDGALRVVDFSIKPIVDDNGQVAMLIPEGRDITERKQMEAQLLQSQKMEAVGTLAGGIAHDFNNNLQAISGYTQLLLMDDYGSDREKEMLATIKHASDHARELTQQLLTFSRKIESRLAPLDLNAELAEVMKMLQRTLPRMIEIETRRADDLRVVAADRTQFEQIVMNLGINGGHAMPDGGRLVIETRNADLDEAFCRRNLGSKPGAYALLNITDSGLGMDASTREHIFEPFFTTRETGAGTGLGLAMVYGIVKSHNGYITCASAPGEGTTFSVYFPAAAMTTAPPGAAGDQRPVDGGRESIMVVDDDQAVRQLGRQLLKRFGYRVCEAPDGEAAPRRYRQRTSAIDLIILDLNMPGMGGVHCLEAIRALDPAVPVLIASGQAPGGQTRATLDALAHGFVGKPYEIKAMLKLVRETLDRAALSKKA